MLIKELMNHDETKEYTGLVRRRPTEEEMTQLLWHHCTELLFREMVFHQCEKFNLSKDDPKGIIAFLDNCQTYHLDYYNNLVLYDYPDTELKLFQMQKKSRIYFEDTARVYDFVHLKIKLAEVHVCQIFPNPVKEANVLSVHISMFKFCNECGNVHSYLPDEMITI